MHNVKIPIMCVLFAYADSVGNRCEGTVIMNGKFLIYMLKRFGMALLTIFLVVSITFLVMHAIPASPFSSEKAKSDATIAALEAKYGFDKPLPVQFINYIKNVLQGDFGLSTKWIGSTVSDLIMGALPYSMQLGIWAAAIAIICGVTLGAIAALNRGRFVDQIIQVVTTGLVSMPNFVIATLLLIVFALKLKLLPTLANLFGVEFDSRLFAGRDVFSDATPLVFNLNYDWKTEYGTYYSSKNNFIPADPNITLPEGYVDAVKTVVRNKIRFCKSVLNTDYFGYLFDE